MSSKHRLALLVLGLFTILGLALTAACTPAAPTEQMHMEEEHGGDEHMDEDEHPSETVPNNGAVIRIISPADGATISGNEIVVEIETENFTLGEDGNHWHVYLDGSEVAMVMGTDTSQVLHGIEPGEHELAVTMSNGEHIELEEGASIHVTVEG